MWCAGWVNEPKRFEVEIFGLFRCGVLYNEDGSVKGVLPATWVLGVATVFSLAWSCTANYTILPKAHAATWADN